MTNNEIKYFSKLKLKKYRDSEKKFLIEGPHLLEECLRARKFDDNIENIFISKGSIFDDPVFLNKIRGNKFEILDTKQFTKLSDTEQSQGIAAVVRQREFPNIFPVELKDKTIIACEGINDPGNMGTIIRTCWWFGLQNIIISKDCADIYNPKTLRASQGGVFHINIHKVLNIEEYLIASVDNGTKVYLTDLKSEYNLSKESISGKTVLVFGNEANGISETLKKNKSFKTIKIDSYSDCESLNVATSVGIFLWTLNRN